MPETISDTGPILHLGEIDRLASLTVVSPLQMPGLVWSELQKRGTDRDSLRNAGIQASVISVAESDWRHIVAFFPADQIQPADAQVFALAQGARFQALTLTDDLRLRRLLERHGATVVGSVGILVRAYQDGVLQRSELDQSIEALFSESTLHLSRAFRHYLRQLLKDL